MPQQGNNLSNDFALTSSLPCGVWNRVEGGEHKLSLCLCYALCLRVSTKGNGVRTMILCKLTFWLLFRQ